MVRRRVSSPPDAVLLTTAEVARALEPELTPAAVRAAARDGRLRPAVVTAGGLRLFARTEVERFQLERTKRAASLATRT
jgi:hypothetical protein